jgi:beta-lactam-binding protein with PASTA domain
VTAVVVAAVAVLAGWYATHPGAPAAGGSAGATATSTATVVAPDLRGQSVTQARKSAQSAHLRVAGVRLGACAPPAAERQVCGQQPAPGSRVRQGTGISLQVSPRSPRRR